MARTPSTFRQQDVTRAIKAFAAAGVDSSRVEVRIEIDRGGKTVIIVSVRADPKDQPGATEPNEWDRV
jgi:hypothetical protein